MNRKTGHTLQFSDLDAYLRACTGEYRVLFAVKLETLVSMGNWKVLLEGYDAYEQRPMGVLAMRHCTTRDLDGKLATIVTGMVTQAYLDWECDSWNAPGWLRKQWTTGERPLPTHADIPIRGPGGEPAP